MITESPRLTVQAERIHAPATKVLQTDTFDPGYHVMLGALALLP